MSEGRDTEAETAPPEGARTPDAPRYDAAFFAALEDGAARSAAIVADLVAGALQPRSVVDVGCGTGRWLAAFRERGAADILGLDGPWVDPAELAIPPGSFRPHDLAAPVRIGRRFDLALCLETAEHLPPGRAAGLVEDLVGLAPVILFSAAIPGQVGTGHINEQWPTYWHDLFAVWGYVCHTALRERLWHREEVEVWYRQNLLVFSAPDRTTQVAEAFGGDAEAPPLDLVHPELYARERRNVENWSLHGQGLQAQLAEAKRLRAATERELRTQLAAARGEIDRLEARLTNRIARVLHAAARRVAGRGPAKDDATEGEEMESHLEQLIAEQPHFHEWDGAPANWAVAPDVLRYLSGLLRPGMSTLETGAGQTTAAFCLAGTRHLAVTPDRAQAERITAYLDRAGVTRDLTFLHESSDTALASGRGIPERLDVVLIDGAHRFPFPIIDWHYTEGRVPVGGYVVLDDCRMPSVRVLHDFLVGEDEWELVDEVHQTAFFRRAKVTVNTSDWADQKINRPHLDRINERRRGAS